MLDAALQLTLPFLDSPPTVTAPAPAGRRRLLLAGAPVEFELRRSRRRTIGFTIDDRGLVVTAPRWVSQRDVDAAVLERGDWVVRKLGEWRTHVARRDRLAVRWAHGGELRLLGQTVVIAIDPEARGVERIGERLVLGLPPGAGESQIRDAVQGWLQRTARAHFAERIPVFAERLGIAPTRWGLSSARTRWGSCGPDGSIRLNWRLLHFPPDIVDYVIAHELAHLRELNHGPRFWATVGDLFPDWREARAWLREYPDDTLAP